MTLAPRPGTHPLAPPITSRFAMGEASLCLFFSVCFLFSFLLFIANCFLPQGPSHRDAMTLATTPLSFLFSPSSVSSVPPLHLPSTPSIVSVVLPSFPSLVRSTKPACAGFEMVRTLSFLVMNLSDLLFGNVLGCCKPLHALGCLALPALCDMFLTCDLGYRVSPEHCFLVLSML